MRTQTQITIIMVFDLNCTYSWSWK